MSYGRARSPATFPVFMQFAARDEFAQTAGALTGKTAAKGGNWTAGFSSFALDTDDFQVDDTNDWAERATINDTGGGRAVHIPSPGSLTNQVVSAVLSADQVGAFAIRQGLQFRAASSGNTSHAWFTRATTGWQVWIQLDVGGSTVESKVAVIPSIEPEVRYRLTVAAYQTGLYVAWFDVDGSITNPKIVGQSSHLATGGALASGKGGLVDYNGTTTAVERRYHSIAVGIPIRDAVIFSDRYSRLTHEAAFRQEAGGIQQEGRVPAFEGKHLELPPATRADRKSRIVVKARRFDVDSGLPDAGLTDNLTGTLKARPRVLLQ